MKRLLPAFFALVLFLTSAQPSFAQFQDWNTVVSGCVVNNIPTLACLPGVFQNIIFAALIFSGVVAVFFSVFAGIKFITSGGDAKQVDSARKTMTFAIIGLVIILLSFFIVKIIAGLTGIDCINTFGFDNCP